MFINLKFILIDIGNNFVNQQVDNQIPDKIRRKRDFNPEYNYASNIVPPPLNFQKNNEYNAYTAPSTLNQNKPYVPDYEYYGKINYGYPKIFNNYGQDAPGPNQYSPNNPNLPDRSYPKDLGNEDFQGQPGPSANGNSRPFAGHYNPMIMAQSAADQNMNEPDGAGIPGQGNFYPMRISQGTEQKNYEPNSARLPANMYPEHDTAFYSNQPKQVNSFPGIGQNVNPFNNFNNFSGFEATTANASSTDPLLLFEQRMHAVEKLKKLYDLKKFLSTDSANVSYTFVGNNKTIGLREAVSLDEIKKEFGALESKYMNQKSKDLEINKVNPNNPIITDGDAYSVGNIDPNLALLQQAQPALPYHPALQQDAYQNQNPYYQNPATQNQYFYQPLNSPQTLNSNSYQQPYPMQQAIPYQQNQDMYSQIQIQGIQGSQYVSNQRILGQNSFSQYDSQPPVLQNQERQNQYAVLPNSEVLGKKIRMN